ncbi:sensor histidine kinase [Aquincola sp. J276]|uniref:sensor histidine kinase n=1 Tax=Aquincola sp. J276 TaxID=2898432 RepID=UPI0021518C5B|nr:sensor histidine kinase [Aquincola sp. J276]MCR5868167.1 hypothetical protein [Aquincola sp. J276]
MPLDVAHPTSQTRLSAWLPTALVLAALLIVSVLGLYGLSAARAFMAAEGRWTKATFTALLSLERFAEHGLPQDLLSFEQAVNVPILIRKARVAMDTVDAPLAVPTRYLVEAGVNAADATLMCRVYRLAKAGGWTRETVARWMEGDDFVEQLIAAATMVPGQASRPLQESEQQALRRSVQALSNRFVEGQGRFSERISDRARLTAYATIAVAVVLTVLLAVAAALHGLRLQKREGRIRAELYAASLRLRLATQSDRLGIFDWEVGAQTVRLDRRCCELYGLTSFGEWTLVDRSTLRHRVHPDDQHALRHAMEHAGRQQTLFKHRFRVVPVPSTIRHMEVTGLCSAELGQLCMVGSVRDVSDEVHRAEAESQARVDETAARTRSRLLSRLSHELRTPLNAILGFTQLLLTQPQGISETQIQWIGRVEQAGKGLLRMIDDVLRITRVSSGGLVLQHERVRLASLLESVLEANEPLQTKQQIQCSVLLPDQAAMVRADPAIVEEAFLRLVEHTWQVVPARAKVDLTCTVFAASIEVRFDAQRWASRPGFGSHLVDEPPSQHLGFALSLVEALLSAMGGRLDVLGRPDGSTSVIAELPRWLTQTSDN